jgi:hypothetical protein
MRRYRKRPLILLVEWVSVTILFTNIKCTLHSADRGAEFVPAREWMRICFGLLDLLKAHKKGIRRAAVNSFGYIAKSLGPQDMLSVLLTNLQVQERQSRVCSTVAIAIVAETCGRELVFKFRILRC